MGGTFSLKRIGGALWPQVQFCVSVITLHWLERNAKDIFGYLLENFLLRRKFSFHFNQARINYSDSSKQKATGFGYRVTGWQKLRSRSTGGARKVRISTKGMVPNIRYFSHFVPIYALLRLLS